MHRTKPITDPYRDGASRWFRVPYEDATPKMRRVFKAQCYRHAYIAPVRSKTTETFRGRLLSELDLSDAEIRILSAIEEDES